MITYPWATRCPIFSWFEATFWFRFTSVHFTPLQFNQVGKGVDTLGGLPPPQAPPGESRRWPLASTVRQMLAWGIEFTGLHRPLRKQDLKGTYLLRDFLTSKFSKPMWVWHAQNVRVAMTAYPWATCCPIFSRFEATSRNSVISRISRKSWEKLEISQLQIALKP